ncbi:MAG: rhodanese-like domain-containing protein [Planktomarina sp.]
MRKILFALCMGFATPIMADNPVLEAMQDYTDFATFNAGIITPEQIDEDIFGSVTFIDTRSEEEFNVATIPGAIHMEWRDIFTNIEDIPTDRKTVLFCNTGALSAQAAFGLRVLGYESVLVLQSGMLGWMTHAAYKPE